MDRYKASRQVMKLHNLFTYMYVVRFDETVEYLISKVKVVVYEAVAVCLFVLIIQI